MPTERIPWEVTIDTTRVALERLSRALIVTSSTMTGSFVLGDYPLGRGVSAFLMVGIYAGEEQRFDSICKPYERRWATRVVMSGGEIDAD